MSKVIIFGDGRTASVGHFYLTHDSVHEVVAFTVDGAYLKHKTLCGLPVVPFENVASIFPATDYAMSIQISFTAVNQLRAEKYLQAKAKGYRLVNYISSKAVTWPDLTLGDNCFILENTTIMPFASLGNNVYVGPNSVIGHHSKIDDHCFLAASATVLGNVTVEPYVFLGGNTTIRDGIKVARDGFIGAHTIIHTNTQEKGVYVGDRAKLLPRPSDKLSPWLMRPM